MLISENIDGKRIRLAFRWNDDYGTVMIGLLPVLHHVLRNSLELGRELFLFVQREADENRSYIRPLVEIALLNFLADVAPPLCHFGSRLLALNTFLHR